MFDENYRVYGVRKIWKALNRQQLLDAHGQPTGRKHVPVARCTVARRMNTLGLKGALAGDHKGLRTTIPATDHRPEDALNRDFSTPAPNTRWVSYADLRNMPIFQAMVQVSSVLRFGRSA